MTCHPRRVLTSPRVTIRQRMQTRPDTFKMLNGISCRPAPAGPECSRNFTAPRGVIKTPGFPDKYPNNLDCTFMIFGPKMSEIVVEFDSFDMEPDTTPPPGAMCRFDWLEIWDGFTAGEGRRERDKCLIGDEKISPRASNKGKCFLLKGHYCIF